MHGFVKVEPVFDAITRNKTSSLTQTHQLNKQIVSHVATEINMNKSTAKSSIKNLLFERTFPQEWGNIFSW